MLMSVSSCDSLPGSPLGDRAAASIQHAAMIASLKGQPVPYVCQIDVWVAIVDETTGETLYTYPAVVEALKQQSKYFAAYMSDNWAQSNANSSGGSSSQVQQQHPIVLMHVDPQHTHPAACLLDFIHNRQPGTPGSSMSAPSDTAAATKTPPLEAYDVGVTATPATIAAYQQYFCILAALADRYHVPGMLTKALLELQASFECAGPFWKAVLFLLHSTHNGVGMDPAFAKPYSLAVQYTLQQLQDLEAVLQDRALTRVLLALPPHVLLMLVQGPDTCVTWESTVVEAITTWLSVRARSCVTAPLLKELSGCVRLRGLPRSYLNTVLTQLDWYINTIEPGTIHQANAFLHIADGIKQQLATAVGAQQHTSAAGTTLKNSGSSSSSSGLSPAAIQESKALSEVLEPLLRSQPQWSRRMLRPRATSRVKGVTLTTDLSMARLTLAYDSITASRTIASNSGSDGSSSSTKVKGVHSQWQMGQGGVGSFGGYHWRLHFRFVAATVTQHRTGTAGQQQAERVTGRKRKQQEAIQQEHAAAAAAAAAAAGSGLQGLPGDQGNAAVRQKLLESVLQQPGLDHLVQPAEAGSGAGQHSPITPPDSSSGGDGSSRGGDGSRDGGGSGGSGTGSASSSSRQPSWLLQFGVSFDVLYLPKEQRKFPPSLMLPPPTLLHPHALKLSGSTCTRGQKLTQGHGLEPGSLPRLLRVGEVLPCVEVLPLKLSSNSWDEACLRKLRPFLDSDERLRASVVISQLQ